MPAPSLFCFLILALLSCSAAYGDYQKRLPDDEIIYFVLPDRFENGDPNNDTGGIPGSRLDHGFDPTHKGFFLGGDFKGLIKRLDYLQALGVTAIWMAPIFKNKPVQGVEPYISAGYHGYWIQDFTQPDPHFGSPEDFRALVDAAHERDMKVIMDIVTNHTADIISYRECHDPQWEGEKDSKCSYRSITDYPYQETKNGKPLNPKFVSDQAPHQTEENFRNLSNMNYAYTPYIPEGEMRKVPEWLNDLRYYHHRGDSSFKGESSLYGDFVGLDDLFTEHPRVVEGFIEVYKQWITEYNVDGFRIDTVKHVNPEFWQAFVPEIMDHAKKQGKDNFYLFGEVYDFNPAELSKYTHVDSLPAVLDFAMQGTIRGIASGNSPPHELGKLLRYDSLYKNAQQLPTFISNHDMGRIGHFLYQDIEQLSEKEALQRSILAHALLIFSRGVPVIYSGDEQGFTGDGNDQDAREPLFPSKVASYNDNIVLGTDKTTADYNFDHSNPIFKSIAKYSKAYKSEIALRRGKQELLYADGRTGGLVFSRQYEGETVIVLANNSTKATKVSFDIGKNNKLKRILGKCSKKKSKIKAKLSPLSVSVCKVVSK